MREHLHVDAGLVHLLEAQLAEVVQPLAHLRVARLGAALLEVRRDFGVPVMLFERDDRVRGLAHVVSEYRRVKKSIVTARPA